ncbi:MAG: PP2C family protein-serine/threonine phosphatase [Phycisphaerales bacterium]
MPDPTLTSPYRSDFHAEFEVETKTLVRRRFMLLCGLVALVNLIVLGIPLLLEAVSGNPANKPESAVSPVAILPGAVVICGVAGLVLAWRTSLSSLVLIRLAYVIIVMDGLAAIWLFRADVPRAPGLGAVLITHLLASITLPWTPRQAATPLIPLLLVNAAVEIALSQRSVPEQVRAILLSLLVGAPGLLVTWAKYTRNVESFKLRFFQRRYGEVKRELIDARRIHESLFPKPISIGPLRFRYLYEPMRQIGGDYLYASELPAPEGRGKRLNVVLMDVTGHGVAAALTVNRLYGELERIFAENPSAPPGEVLRLLNRYVHLTLAPHSVYATTLCARVDPVRDIVEYASAGHPPGILRSVDGRIHELPCTAMVLGASPEAEFLPAQASEKFVAGDALILYTDGALEARGKDRRMLGLKGLRDLIARSRPMPDGGWPRTVLAAVEAYRVGAPTDDTLVVEVSRPVGERPSGTWAFGPTPGERYGIVVRDDLTRM